MNNSFSCNKFTAVGWHSGQQTVGEHKDYVNSVASCPEKGDKVASVSDDHTCIVWSATDAGKQEACFPLTSPGMTVRWHPKETGQVFNSRFHR